MSKKHKSSTGDRGGDHGYLKEVKDQETETSIILHDVPLSSGQPAKWTKVFRYRPETGEKYLALHIENGVTLFEINP